MTGCNDEDSSAPNPTQVDISEAVGTYSGFITVTDLQGEEIANIETPFTVSKGSNNSTLKIDVEGDIFTGEIIGEQIIVTDNGFVFDIVEGSWSEYYITKRKSFRNNSSLHSGLFNNEGVYLFGISMGISETKGGDVYVYYQLSGIKD